jgi:hypothetical protein
MNCKEVQTRTLARRREGKLNPKCLVMGLGWIKKAEPLKLTLPFNSQYVEISIRL